MRTLGIVVGVGVIALAVSGLREARAGEDASQPEFYTTKVQPVLEKNCGSCHLGMNHRGGFNMATRANLLKGGHDGPGVVPGDADKSLVILLMRHQGPADDPKPMPPPPRPKVSDDDIATVAEWVKAGAAMPDDAPKP